MKLNFFHFNSEKLPRAVRRLFAPPQKFREMAKGRFLAVFDARYPAHTHGRAAYPQFLFAVKALAGALAAAAIVLGGVSVYADTKNVPADSPLYPLKRLSETVQLAVTAPSAKADLQATFAVKRAAEISDLSARHPTSTLLAGLANDLDTDVSSSLGSVEQGEQENVPSQLQTQSQRRSPSFPPPSFMALPVPSSTQSSSRPQVSPQLPPQPPFQNQPSRVERRGICNTLGFVFGTTSSIIQNELSKHPETARRFMSACQGDTEDTSMATTTALSASSTFSPPTLPPKVRFEKRGSDDRGAGSEASTTATTTIEATTTVTTPSFFDRMFHNDD
jgi:hypothetical protein